MNYTYVIERYFTSIQVEGAEHETVNGKKREREEKR